MRRSGPLRGLAPDGDSILACVSMIPEVEDVQDVLRIAGLPQGSARDRESPRHQTSVREPGRAVNVPGGGRRRRAR